jgi:hypothetical protein
LEELLSKEHENVPLPLLTTEAPDPSLGVQPFKPDQLVACESCLRTNPPTRVNCLYCGANLPIHDGIADLQKPALRPLESWEQGYNNILKPRPAIDALNLSETAVAEAADLLKLEAPALSRIISSKQALPLARTATRDEATLVQRRLRMLGIDSDIVADVNLATDGSGPLRVRAIEIADSGLKAYERPGAQPVDLLWSEIVLMVVGRLTVQRVESREEASRKENRLLDSSEFFSDETVFDFYNTAGKSFRIMSKSFDFSCLGTEKGLLAEQNMATLLALFREQASNAGWDDSFNSVRKELEVVWPSERRAESAGWRRDRPGKITKGSITEINNESQFQKYSWLRHHLTSPTQRKANEES